MITINGDLVTITKETVETIDLLPLKEELSSLKAMAEPTKEEVLNLALQGIIHPYHDPVTKNRIIQLERELAQWQSK